MHTLACAATDCRRMGSRASAERPPGARHPCLTAALPRPAQNAAGWRDGSSRGMGLGLLCRVNGRVGTCRCCGQLAVGGHTHFRAPCPAAFTGYLLHGSYAFWGAWERGAWVLEVGNSSLLQYSPDTVLDRGLPELGLIRAPRSQSQTGWCSGRHCARWGRGRAPEWGIVRGMQI